MKLQELIDFGMSPATAVEELRRHETEGEPLVKHQWRAQDLIATLGSYGWQFGRQGGDHEIYVNPGVPGRPLAIKRGHARGKLDPFWTKKYFSDAGLKWNPHDNSVRPNPAHPYAPHYAAMGKT